MSALRVYLSHSNAQTVRKLRRHLGKNTIIVDSVYKDGSHSLPREELLQRVTGCDGILCLLTEKVDKELIQAAGNKLKVVSTMSVGYNHIDIQECKKIGIQVGFTPDVLNTTTAETAVALTFAVKRKLISCAEGARVNWGKWQPYQYCGNDVSQNTVGVIGLGRIGATYARMMKFGFNCKILYTSRRGESKFAGAMDAEFVSFNELMERSDIVSVHCALNEESTKIISYDALKRMKKSAVLINTSRGETVDQDALLKALQKNEIAGAGLDVTYPEPLPKDHQLFNTPNCLILPHIGSATMETRNAMLELATDNLIASLLGKQMPSQLNI